MSNLNEEEIIEELTVFGKEESKYKYGQAILGLLDLYKAEKEKNKENIKAIEEWINGERISPVIQQKYISKDKIKEAMKDCVSSYDCLKEKINILLYGEEYFK